MLHSLQDATLSAEQASRLPLDTFFSSWIFHGPTVEVTEVVSDGFPLRAGYGTSGIDALADPRVVKVLTDAGRWVAK